MSLVLLNFTTCPNLVDIYDLDGLFGGHTQAASTRGGLSPLEFHQSNFHTTWPFKYALWDCPLASPLGQRWFSQPSLIALSLWPAVGSQ